MLTQEEYNAKRQARYERLLAVAERAEREGQTARTQAHEMAQVIPFGQPIHVGHHSERADRNYRSKIENKYRKGFELAKQAEELRNRADATANNYAIYTADPSAADQLRAKLTALEAERDEMKRINKELRQGIPFEDVDMTGAHRTDLLTLNRTQPYYQPLTKGFPPYALTNLGATIRNTKARLEQVEKQQAIPDKDEMIGDIKIEWRASEDRIRIIYPGRVDRETFAKLRQYGYRATKEDGVFSAYYNYRAGEFVKALRAGENGE